MSYLVVPISSQTASFRDPEFQNFHRSLPLPPPATCIGLAGAALGLSPASAQNFFTEGEWEIGIAGTSEGLATDLWKYNNLKVGSSILIREILYGNRFVIVFGHADAQRIHHLREAFARPYFALSCGPSDSICTVDVQGLIAGEGGTQAQSLVNCYVDGDIVADTLSAVKEGGSASFSIRTTSTPLAQDLPVRFNYETGGIRMLRQRRLISYVQYPTKLPLPVAGIQYPLHRGSDSAPSLFVPVFPL